MTRLWLTLCGLATRLGLRRITAVTKTMIQRAAVRADTGRYRRYAEAKRRIPMNISPKEYEAEVKRLAKKFKI